VPRRVGLDPRALAAYNGGKGGNITPPYRNQPYADKVLAAKAQQL
jgi:soluble lytic murein transglycosylase-like protein